jgi:hypothetical protein
MIKMGIWLKLLIIIIQIILINCFENAREIYICESSDPKFIGIFVFFDIDYL